MKETCLVRSMDRNLGQNPPAEGPAVMVRNSIARFVSRGERVTSLADDPSRLDTWDQGRWANHPVSTPIRLQVDETRPPHTRAVRSTETVIQHKHRRRS